MRFAQKYRAAALVGWVIALSASRADGQTGVAFFLTEGTAPRATIVAGPAAGQVELTAVEQFVAGVRNASNVMLPVNAALPPSPEAAVVIGTVAGNPALAALASQLSLPVNELADEAFLLRTLTAENRPILIIAASDERGVLFGVQEALDQVISATPQNNVYAVTCSIQKAPALHVRGTYSLTCWGSAPRFDRAHWEMAIDSMSTAGMNRIMFWMDGLFRSRRYPYTFLDQTYFAGVQLTDDDIHRLIVYAHARGMEFLFGSGVFGWFTSETFAQRFPEAADHAGNNLSPCHPLAHQLTRDYLAEMIEVFPEADGYMLEIRDEIGEDFTPACQVALDGYGSRQYGQSELDLLDSLRQAVWPISPSAKFVWLVGYDVHDRDVLYYDRIGAMSANPRMEWMKVRGGYTWPATNPGSPTIPLARPITAFSEGISDWDHYYMQDAAGMRYYVQQAVNHGLNGYTPAYEPGFATASIYGDRVIPYPVDRIPYVLTQFYYRTFTWDPYTTDAALLERAHRKFFTPDVGAELTSDLFFLQEFNLENHTLFSGIGLLGVLRQPSLAAAVDQVWNDRTYFANKEFWLNRLADHVRTLQALATGGNDMVRIAEIESRIAAVQATTSLRARAGLDLMQQAIDDIRAHLASDPDVDEADYTLYHIAVLLAEYRGETPPPPPFTIIRPTSVQDGHVYAYDGTVHDAGSFSLWGKYQGAGVHSVGIHSLPSVLGPNDVAWATLRIPRTDNPWTIDGSCLSLDMRLKHINAADDTRVTPGDGTSPSLSDLGLYRAAGPYLPDNARFIQFDVTQRVRVDLEAGRASFAWRLEPVSVPDGVFSTRYLPAVESTDLAFSEINRGASLMLKVVEGSCGDGADNDEDGRLDCDDSDCADTITCRPRYPDADEDGDVDQTDFGWFQACLTDAYGSPIDSGCESANFDRDDDVDRLDFALLQSCYSGPNVPAAPGCTR